jgi:capsular polysaccharide biosynthesis protein
VEIVDYLGIARRRLWILILVPALAAAGTTAWLIREPRQYQSKVVVAAPALIGGANAQTFSGSNGLTQYVSNFMAAATTPAVVDRVSKETGVKSKSITSGLSVSQIGSSSQVQVLFTTSRQRLAAPVATATARDTLAFLFGSQVTLAQRSLATAQAAADKVQAQIIALEAKANLAVAPDTYADQLSQQIGSLQQQQLQLSASGQFAGAAGLADSIATKQQQLSALAPVVRNYLQLSTQQTAALSLVQTMQQNLAAAEQQQAAADPASALHVSQTHVASRVDPVLKRAIPAAGVGLFLAVGLVLLLEVFRSSRRRGPPAHVPAPASFETRPASSIRI